MSEYLTSPRASKNMPKGIPYIIGNELAERFSFYGMKCILFMFMTEYLIIANGPEDHMSDPDATFWTHIFGSAVYFTPILGAILADVFLGKYKTILLLSIVYCLGHFALAINETPTGLIIGLSLISIGAGGIKPCVSAHVGDQFSKSNGHLLEKVFGWFYLSINIGAAISMLLTPFLLEEYGPKLAFGIPGILMLAATIVFWMGRHVFIHIPPSKKEILNELTKKDNLQNILKLLPIYMFIAIFWSLFDQTATTWISQSEYYLNKNWLGREWITTQMQAMNPILIFILVPLCTYWLYPLMNKYFNLTPIKKISIGLFIAVPSFLIVGYIQTLAETGNYNPSIGWQFPAYIILTTAEIFISITCLELSYTQAPNSLKSIIMGLFLLSMSFGNLFTAIFVKIMPSSFVFIGPELKETSEGISKLVQVKHFTSSYFYFYAWLMLSTAILFLFIAKKYKSRTYLHKESI